jgi:hypothetical protein
MVSLPLALVVGALVFGSYFVGWFVGRYDER